jgi:hypothetical protein
MTRGSFEKDLSSRVAMTLEIRESKESRLILGLWLGCGLKADF